MDFKDFITEHKEVINEVAGDLPANELHYAMPLLVNTFLEAERDAELTVEMLKEYQRGQRELGDMHGNATVIKGITYFLKRLFTDNKEENEKRAQQDKNGVHVFSGNEQVEFIGTLCNYFVEKLGLSEDIKLSKFEATNKLPVSQKWLDLGTKNEKHPSKVSYYTTDKKWKINASTMDSSRVFKGTGNESKVLFNAVMEKYFVEKPEVYEKIANIIETMLREKIEVSSSITLIKIFIPVLEDLFDAQGLEFPEDSKRFRFDAIEDEHLAKAESIPLAKKQLKSWKNKNNIELDTKKFQFNASSIKDLLMKTFDNDLSEFIAVKGQDKIHDELQELVGTFIETNTFLKTKLVKEGYTGELKFEGNDLLIANAVAFYSTLFEGQKGSYAGIGHSIIKEITDGFCEKISSSVKLKINFADTNDSNVEKRNAFPGLELSLGGSEQSLVKGNPKKGIAGIGDDMDVEPLGLITKESLTTYMDTLIEEANLEEIDVLTEGFLDSAGATITYVKNKIKDIIADVMKKIKEMAKKGMKALLEFLGFEVGSVSLSLDLSEEEYAALVQT